MKKLRPSCSEAQKNWTVVFLGGWLSSFKALMIQFDDLNDFSNGFFSTNLNYSTSIFYFPVKVNGLERLFRITDIDVDGPPGRQKNFTQEAFEFGIQQLGEAQRIETGWWLQRFGNFTLKIGKTNPI